jgi:hypothetical protein
VLEELAGEVLHGVVVRGRHHVVVEAVVALPAQLDVVHALRLDLVEARAAVLEQVLGRIGRGGHNHVHVALPHEPGEERPEPRARERPGQPERDHVAAVDHAGPGRERLPELPALEGPVSHALQHSRDGSAGLAAAGRTDQLHRAALGPGRLLWRIVVA